MIYLIILPHGDISMKHFKDINQLPDQDRMIDKFDVHYLSFLLDCLFMSFD